MLPPEDPRPAADTEGAVEAEAGPKNPPRPGAEVTERLSEMRWVLGGFERALVLTHDNPDPDAIASAAGLGFLVERISGIPVTVAFGGIIGDGLCQDDHLQRCRDRVPWHIGYVIGYDQ